jgi:hypothetical protein
VPLKLTVVVPVLLHTVWSEIALTVGVGFTVILKVCAVPEQPLTVGVTVIVPDIADVPVFFAVKDVILPEPLAASPIDVLLFVQL